MWLEYFLPFHRETLLNSNSTLENNLTSPRINICKSIIDQGHNQFIFNYCFVDKVMKKDKCFHH